MTFQWPYLLFSLGLVPILLALYLLAQRRRRAYALRFTNLPLLDEVVGRRPGVRRHIPPLLFLLGLAALLVSLARPTATIAVPRDHATVMLVLDVSGSMAASDLQPNRMAAAKAAAHSFVEALPDGFQVGVVSFNQSASVTVPPTHDHALVARAIDALAATGGTAIGDGLNLTLDQLAQRPANGEGQRAPALVVLLSDGQSTHGALPAAAAARAKGEGVRVHTVGIGRRDAAPQLGRGQRVDLDETTLRDIAGETGGEYFYAAEAGELEQVYTDLGSQVRWVEERTEVTALASALGAVLLLIGGVLSLHWFRQFP